MTPRTRETDLGPFAAESGRAAATSLVGIIAGALALSLAVVRMVVNASGGPEARALTSIAQGAAAIGIAVALVGLYQVSVIGRPGRALARAALIASAVGGVVAFLYAADRDGSLQLGRLSDSYLNPDLLFSGAILSDLWKGLLNTMEAAFVAEVVALLLGLLVATFELSPRRWLRYPARAYVDVIRGTPLVVLTLLISFGLPRLGVDLPFLAKVVTVLAINASAYIAEIFRAGIQAIPRGQIDAARGLGMPSGAAMVHVIIPQAVRAVIPPQMSEFIALIKDTAIVFLLVGVTVASRDVFTAARAAASSTFSPTPFVMAAIAYMIVTIPLTRLVDVVERRLRRGLV